MKMWNIGLGLTNKCNLKCPHCYSRDLREDLDPVLVKNLFHNVGVSSVNFGTGESGLYPYFREIIRHLSDIGIKLSLTTNGYTIKILKDEELASFNDIDFSLDFPSPSKHNAWRGKGTFENVIQGIQRCKSLSVETSIVTCLMNLNSKSMLGMLDLAHKLETNLRINIYKPVRTRKFELTYRMFWSAIKEILAHSRIISCSEPIISTIVDEKVKNTIRPCGKNSFRVAPNGDVLPCVYWNKSDVNLYNLNPLSSIFDKIRDSNEFTYINTVPNRCKSCEYEAICGGGCASRRLYTNFSEPDKYCYKLKGEHPSLDFEWSKNRKSLIHSNYLCTLIVEPLL